jgi:hypothetical protein
MNGDKRMETEARHQHFLTMEFLIIIANTVSCEDTSHVLDANISLKDDIISYNK